jgi:hypothetical protein
LRYAIFAGEMGAKLHNRIPGLDHDRFDAYCQHLLVRDGLGSGHRLHPPAHPSSTAKTMRLLLDTGILHDWRMGAMADTEAVRSIRQAGTWVSAVSIWEMAIQQGLGKLPFPSR